VDRAGIFQEYFRSKRERWAETAAQSTNSTGKGNSGEFQVKQSRLSPCAQSRTLQERLFIVLIFKDHSFFADTRNGDNARLLDPDQLFSGQIGSEMSVLTTCPSILCTHPIERKQR